MVDSGKTATPDLSCLIISFARPESLKQIMKECLLAPNRRIYLFVDLATDSFVKENREVINLALTYSNNSNIRVKVALSPHGPQAGVAAGMAWAFELENELLVIEDDTILNSETFRYFEIARDALGPQTGIICSLSPYAIDELGNLNCRKSHLSSFALTNCWMLKKQLWLESTKPVNFSNLFQNLNRGYSFYSSYLFFLSGALRFEGKVGRTGWDSKMQFALLRSNLKAQLPSSNLSGNSGNDHVASNTTAIVLTHNNHWEMGNEISNMNLCESAICDMTIAQIFRGYFGISWKSILSPIKTFLILFKNQLTSSFKR